mgnify:CR=1 FL=1
MTNVLLIKRVHIHTYHIYMLAYNVVIVCPMAYLKQLGIVIHIYRLYCGHTLTNSLLRKVHSFIHIHGFHTSSFLYKYAKLLFCKGKAH